MEEEEEESCREHSPREDRWGVSGLAALLGFCLFAGFPSASAESTMRAGLQLQLMGPALAAARGAGKGGKDGGREAAGGTQHSSPGQGGAPSEPSRVGRTEGRGEEDEEKEEEGGSLQPGPERQGGIATRAQGDAGDLVVSIQILLGSSLLHPSSCIPKRMSSCRLLLGSTSSLPEGKQLSHCSPCTWNASSQHCPGHADNSTSTSTQGLHSSKSRCGWGKNAGRKHSGRKGV